MGLFIKSSMIILAATAVIAHPGLNHAAEAAERSEALSRLTTRSLGSCSSALKARGITEATAYRRQNEVQKKSKLSLISRDVDVALNTSHHSNLTHITPFTDPIELFENSSSCVLVPEITQGPYYITGELIRSHLAEDQIGVPLYIDVQFIDVTTCTPITGMAVDCWSANATGYYSGIAAQAGLDTTWLRGIQVTDAEGVVAFETIVPGHYAGRTHHIHLVAHSPGTWSLLPNGTITGQSQTSHIGQLFFDQDLVDAVETYWPYTLNTQARLYNEDDSILIQEANATGVDPMLQYVLLGDSVEDGIYSWISIGVDPTAEYSVSQAVSYYEDGAVENPCLEIDNPPPGQTLPALPSYCTADAASSSSS